MRIEAIKFVPPDHKMTNNDVIDLIRDTSKDVFDGDFDTALRSVEFMLDKIGLRERYWMKDQKPLDLMVQAAESAILEAGVEKKDIDVLIFCGITRGFLEPADSYFIAQALGLDDVDCFDVVDACMAWSRSCDIVESFFKAGRYKLALIVNAEDYFRQGGVSFPSNFQLRNFKSIEYSFGAFCGGDGAAATILSAEGQDWERYYLSSKKGADLCTIPLPGYQRCCKDTSLIALNGMGAFTAFSSRVFHQAFPYMVAILKKINHHFNDITAIYAHTGGDVNAYESWAREAGAGGKVRYMFPNFGNLGSVSMPASIAHDIELGRVTRGDKLGCWIGSSGMSFTSYVLTY